MYIGIFLVSVLIASISQVLLKKSAMKHYAYKFGDYLNPYVICAYGLLFFSMFLTVLAYRGVELKTGPVIEATSYIYVAILSAVFLKEKITNKKKLGLLIIIIGILVSNL
ncbi:MAG: EamA family transporter [Lachnospiraceae bacterium]|nr:EamA family transporter [Lachnospiraceae bacterium]